MTLAWAPHAAAAVATQWCHDTSRDTSIGAYTAVIIARPVRRSKNQLGHPKNLSSIICFKAWAKQPTYARWNHCKKLHVFIYRYDQRRSSALQTPVTTIFLRIFVFIHVISIFVNKGVAFFLASAVSKPPQWCQERNQGRDKTEAFIGVTEHFCLVFPCYLQQKLLPNTVGKHASVLSCKSDIYRN